MHFDFEGYNSINEDQDLLEAGESWFYSTKKTLKIE